MFTPVYVPVGVPTFHMESAEDAFLRSIKLLKAVEPSFVVPDEMLLSVSDVASYLKGLSPDLIVFQNLTFANAAYMQEVLRVYDGPLLVWTLREPVIDGGRLRLNSLTGAYSAANTLRAFDDRPFSYLFGSPEEMETEETLRSAVAAARVKKEMRSLKLAAVGLTPQGFGFGRGLDAELMNFFGVELVSVEARELIARAKETGEKETNSALKQTEKMTKGLDRIPEKNRVDHARLFRAYSDFVRENGIGALASRCWPDFFTEFGTPVCTVLSMLNDLGIPSSCEADVYGALSMWVGEKISGAPVFFGDPVSLDEEDNTVTFWHCGAAACSLARKDTGAEVGVHPNRKIGPVMDFGLEAFQDATIFRIGREPDGLCRFFIAEGSALDRPKQFTGTSVVVRPDADSRMLVEESVMDGFEPHFVVIRGRHARTLRMLAESLDFPVFEY